MIRHIALLKLTPDDDDRRAERLAEMQQRLGALVGVVPGLRRMTVEPDVALTADNWDLAIVTDHDDQAAFDVYEADPTHAEASAWIHQFVVDRAAVDFEIDH
ncbi:MAG: Dabb family protein [Pseudolysinimonas sp.]